MSRTTSLHIRGATITLAMIGGFIGANQNIGIALIGVVLVIASLVVNMGHDVIFQEKSK